MYRSVVEGIGGEAVVQNEDLLFDSVGNADVIHGQFGRERWQVRYVHNLPAELGAANV